MRDRKCVPIKALEFWVLSPEIKTTWSLAVGSLTLFTSPAPLPRHLYPFPIVPASSPYKRRLQHDFKNLVSKSFTQ